MRQSVADEQSWYHSGHVFTGDMLDGKSVSVLRRYLGAQMKSSWSKYWVPGMNSINRNRLVFNCMRKLDQYWAKNNGDPIYSAAAVSEEIDYYLPKVFWRVKRKKKSSPSGIVISPFSKTFSNWNFEYEETQLRLQSEYENRVNQLEQNRVRQAERENALAINVETGEVLEPNPNLFSSANS